MNPPLRRYIPQGSLQEAVIYPDEVHECTVGDDVLRKLLKDVKLEHLLDVGPDGLRNVAEWSSMLSGGEKQRLGFARLFYHVRVSDWVFVPHS